MGKNEGEGRHEKVLKKSDICIMQDSKAYIVTEFKSIIEKIYGERLARLILFGSYARGEEKANSDLDFLVVLKDKSISTFKEIEKINPQAYQLSLKYNKIISFVPTTLSKFNSSPNFFYRIIKQEGKLI